MSFNTKSLGCSTPVIGNSARRRHSSPHMFLLFFSGYSRTNVLMVCRLYRSCGAGGATVVKRVSCLFIQKRFYKPFTCFFIQKHVLLIKTMCTKSIRQRKPRTQRHILKNIANVYIHLLGCIKTTFCKKIYVCQHLSSFTRCAHFYACRTSASSQTIDVKKQQFW